MATGRGSNWSERPPGRLGSLGRSAWQPSRSNRAQGPRRRRGEAAFVLPLALVAGLVLATSSLSLLAAALASRQALAADQRRRQADDGLRDLAQLLAQGLVGHQPEELAAAGPSPELLALALPARWQLAGLQWQTTAPADLSLATLQVSLAGPRGEQRQGLVRFNRSAQDGRITSLRQEGA